MRKQQFSRAYKLRQDRLTEAYFGVEEAIDSSVTYLEGGCWGETEIHILKHDKIGTIPYEKWEKEEDAFLEKPFMQGLMYRKDRLKYPYIKNRKMRVYRVKITDITDSKDSEDQKWVEAAQSSHDRDVKYLDKLKEQERKSNG
jgi:hypothetical protein